MDLICLWEDERWVGSIGDGGQNGKGSEQVDDTGELGRLNNSKNRQIQIELDKIPNAGGPVSLLREC